MGERAIKLTAILAVALGAFPGIAGAQADIDFPSVPINMETLRVQAKAEALFEDGNFKRAYFIYRNELAPIGDKYSQYMVGYMHLTGKGTDEDQVSATAWYRLAAERGTPEFVSVRDRLMASLTPEEEADSDRRFIALRKQYGDLMLLMQAVRSDFKLLQDRTGSRLSSDAGPLTVIDMRRGGAIGSGAEYYGKIEKRLRSRLEFIVRFIGDDADDLDVQNADLDAIEARLNTRLDELD